MLKNLVLLLVLPPINLVFLALAGLLMQQRWPRIGRGVALVAVLGLLLLATPLVSGVLLGPLERGLPVAPQASLPPQAIVVLGAEVMRTPSDPHGAVAGRLSMERVLTATVLHRRTGLPVLISGGSPGGDVPPVAPLMAASIDEVLGVPARWVEARSADTWENARFSAAILREAGVTAIYVVTHPWHMPRALEAFAPTGLAVTAAPTPLQRPASLVAADFLPRTSAWQTSYFALHEWVGRVWYAFR
jgi:uncharacterized SAM-binding protein YcdF (DUF218 family)